MPEELSEIVVTAKRRDNYTFPQDTLSYKGQLRFTLVDEFDSPLGSQVNLYMPQGIQYADKVEYENAELGAIGGGFVDTGDEKLALPSESLKDKGVQNSVISSVTAKLNETAGTVARARTRQSPNPNTRALFKQVGLRSFAFQFKLIPVNEYEANLIASIIKLFRTELYPEEIPFDAGEVSLKLGYKFPNRFRIEQIYDGVLSTAQKIEPAYLDSFTTNYNSTAQTFFRGRDGKPYHSEIDIAMTFIESKTLSRASIGKGY
jgi:hypothetical protein